MINASTSFLFVEIIEMFYIFKYRVIKEHTCVLGHPRLRHALLKMAVRYKTLCFKYYFVLLYFKLNIA